MTSSELMVVPKPQFYEKHERLMQQTLLEEETLSMYLEENMHNFYGCFEDMTKVLDVYS